MSEVLAKDMGHNSNLHAASFVLMFLSAATLLSSAIVNSLTSFQSMGFI